MKYDIAIIDGLPVCQREERVTQPGDECNGCYGMGKDGDGTPICMAYVRDAVLVVEAPGAVACLLRGA